MTPDPVLLDFAAKVFASFCASVPLVILAVKGLRQAQSNGGKAQEIHVLVNSQKQELERLLAAANERIAALEDLLEGQFTKFRALDDQGL